MKTSVNDEWRGFVVSLFATNLILAHMPRAMVKLRADFCWRFLQLQGAFRLQLQLGIGLLSTSTV